MARSVEIRITTDTNLADMTKLTKAIDLATREVLAFNRNARTTTTQANAAAKSAKTMSTAFSGLGKSLSNVAPKMIDTAIAITEVRQAIKQFATATDKIDDGFEDALATFLKITREIKETSAAIKELGGTVRKSSTTTDRLTKDTKEAARSIDKLSDEAVEARADFMTWQRQLGTVGTSLNRVEAEMKQQQQTMARVESASKSLAHAYQVLEQAEKELRAMEEKGSASTVERQRALEKYNAALAQARSARTSLMTAEKQMAASEQKLMQTSNDLIQKRTAAENLLASGMTKSLETQQRYAAMLTNINAALPKVTETTTRWRTVEDDLEAVIGAANKTIDRSIEGKTRLANVAKEVTTAERNMGDAADVATRSFREMAEPITRLVTMLTNLGRVLATAIAAGARTAASALGTLGNTAASVFARMQAALNSATKGFQAFGINVKSSMDMATRSMTEFYMAGHSVIMAGQQVMDMGRRMLDGMSGGMNEYTSFEKQATRAAIAAETDVDFIREMVFSLKEGAPGTEGLRGFTPDELAEATYYWSSAMGTKITEENRAAVEAALIPILQMAQATGTDVESAIKGTLNLAMEFGYNPRKIGEGDMQESESVGKIASQMGYLANLSTMEVQDIVESAKMVGPMAGVLSGSLTDPGAGLTDFFTSIFFASEMGLRGGNVGRGIAQRFTSLNDPTQPMLDTAAEIFGIENTKEAFQDFFFDETGVLEGGVEGFIRKFATSVEPGKEALAAKTLAEMFTNNATREMLTQVTAFIKDPEAWDRVRGELESDAPTDWLDNALTVTNDTIYANIQNFSNAWFAVQAEIINAIEGPLKNALQTAADLFWDIAKVIKDNPWIGELIAAFGTFLGVAMQVTGALLVLVGGVLVTMNGLSMLAGAVPAASVLFLSFLKILAILTPMLLGIGLAIAVLKVAWDTDFAGMRSAYEDFIANFSFEKDVAPKFKAVGQFLLEAYDAVISFVEGFVFARHNMNVFGEFLDKLFGARIGNVVHASILTIRDALHNVRKEVVEMIRSADLGRFVQAFRFADSVIRQFVQTFLTGWASMEQKVGAGRFAIALGFDEDQVTDFIVAVDNAALKARDFVDKAMAAFAEFRERVKAIFSDIGLNLSEIFTVENLQTLLEVLGALALGFSQGLAAGILVALSAIELFTEALTNTGEWGTALADYIEQWTGFEVTLTGVAQAVGVAIGLWLGTRLVASLTPAIGLVATLATNIASVGVAVAAQATRLAFFIGQMTLMGVSMATTAAIASTQFVVSLLTSEGAITKATAAFQKLTAFALLANAPMVAIVAVLALLAAGFVYAYTTSEDFRDAINSIAGDVLTGFLEMLGQMTAVVMTAASAIGAVLGAAISLFGDLLIKIAPQLAEFHGFWEAIGRLLPLVIASAMMPMVKSLFLMIAPIALLTAKIMLVVAAIVLVVKVFQTLYSEVEIFRNFVDTLVKIWQYFQIGLSKGWDKAGAAIIANMTYAMKLVGRAYIESLFGVVAEVGKYIPILGEELNAVFGSFDPTAMIADEQRAKENVDKLNALMAAEFENASLGIPIGFVPPSEEEREAQTQDIKQSFLDSLSKTFTEEDGAVGSIVQGFLDQFAVDVTDFEGGDFDTFYREAMDEYAKSIGIGSDTVNQALMGAGLDAHTASKIANDAIQESAGFVFDEAAAIAGNEAKEEAKDIDKIADEFISSFQASLTKVDGALEDGAESLDITRRDVFSSIFDPWLTNEDSEAMIAKYEEAGPGAKPFIDLWTSYGAKIGQKIREELKKDPELVKEYGGLGSNFLEITSEAIAMGYGDALQSYILGDNQGTDNVHTATRPVIEALAKRYGIDPATLMAELPRWLNNQATLRLSEGELFEWMFDVGEDVVKRLNSIQIDDSRRVGIEWADIIKFADVKAQTGEDWNLVNYIAERWNKSISEAEQIVASYGLDPEVISEAMFPDLDAYYAAHPEGDPRFIAGEIWDMYKEYLIDGTDDAIRVTREEWEQIPQAAKIAFESMNLRVVIDEEVDEGKKALKEGGEELTKEMEAINKRIQSGTALLLGDTVAPDRGDDGKPTTLKIDYEKLKQDANTGGKEVGKQFVLGVTGPMATVGTETEKEVEDQLSDLELKFDVLAEQSEAVAKNVASVFAGVLNEQIPIAVQNAFSMGEDTGGLHVPGVAGSGEGSPIVNYFRVQAQAAADAFGEVLKEQIPLKIREVLYGPVEENPTGGKATGPGLDNPFASAFGFYGYNSGQKFQDGLQNAFDELPKIYEEEFGTEENDNPFATYFETFGTLAGEAFVDSLETDLTTNLPATLLAATNDLAGANAETGRFEFLDKFTNLGKLAASSFMTGINDLKVNVGTFAAGVASAFELGIKTLSMHAYAAGNLAKTELLRGLEGGAEGQGEGGTAAKSGLAKEVGDKAVSVVSAFRMGLSMLPTEAENAASAAKSKIQWGTAGMAAIVGDNTTSIVNTFKTNLEELATEAGRIATETKNEFVSGISGLGVRVSELATIAVNSLVLILQGASTNAYQYGKDVVTEFARGMEEGQPELDAAAKETRDKLPSSPAKKGPLSDPISFQYIIDSLHSAMGQAPNAVERPLRVMMSNVMDAEHQYQSRMATMIARHHELRAMSEEASAGSREATAYAARRERRIADSKNGLDDTNRTRRSINNEEVSRAGQAGGRTVNVHIDNVVINRDVDIDKQIDRIDRLTGQRTELLRRGQRPLDRPRD